MNYQLFFRQQFVGVFETENARKDALDKLIRDSAPINTKIIIPRGQAEYELNIGRKQFDRDLEKIERRDKRRKKAERELKRRLRRIAREEEIKQGILKRRKKFLDTKPRMTFDAGLIGLETHYKPDYVHARRKCRRPRLDELDLIHR